MRVRCLCLLILIVIWPVLTLGSVGIGIHLGRTEFNNSIKSGDLIGAQVYFGLLRFIEIEARSTYFKKNFSRDFHSPEFVDQISYQVQHEMKLLGVEGTLRLKLDPILLPFVPYLGAGIGSYKQEYRLESNLDNIPSGIDIQEIIPRSQRDWGVHGIIGTRLHISSFPLQVFIEGKYTLMNAREKDLKSWACYAGINFPVF
ncbi:MAG: hypothetical protein KBA26_08995 [Candidatus Delongbacteria bacterium]|nr:hypothetical protein [Candidatus Delongbacteria bacterium]